MEDFIIPLNNYYSLEQLEAIKKYDLSHMMKVNPFLHGVLNCRNHDYHQYNLFTDFISDVKILNSDTGYNNICIKDYQKHVLDDLLNFRFLAIFNERQMGISLMINIYLVYELLKPNKKILLIDYKSEIAYESISKIKNIINLLPLKYQPGFKSNNKYTVDLHNGSSIKTHINKRNEIISNAYDIIVINNCLYMSEKEFKTIINDVIPTMSTACESKIILNSSVELNNEYKIDEYVPNTTIFKKSIYKKNNYINNDENYKINGITVTKELYDKYQDLIKEIEKGF